MDEARHDFCRRVKKPRGERENDVLVGSLMRGKLLAYCEKSCGTVCLGNGV